MEHATIDDLYREVKSIQKRMVTREEIDRMMEAIFILSNEQTMLQILGSEKDIATGRVKKIGSVHEI
jgi:hypothetical protein